jgi:hypothetical protein
MLKDCKRNYWKKQKVKTDWYNQYYYKRCIRAFFEKQSIQES